MSRNTYLFFLFGFFSLTIAACSPRAHQHDDLADPAEVPSRALTKWSVHEFFVEHDLAVVDIPAGFAVHVTDLRDGAPRTDGLLTLAFKSGEENFEVPIKEPARPGIYLAEVSFPSAGEWEWSVGIDYELVGFPSIQVFASLEERANGVTLGAEDTAGITMLKEQQWPVRMRVEAASLRELSSSIPATARVIACRTHTARIPAPLAGKLLPPATAQRIAIGQTVSAGETLGILRTPLLSAELADWESALAQAKHNKSAAEADLTTARAGLDRTEKSTNRIHDLHAKQAKSDRELEEANYLLASARGAIKAAESSLKAWDQALRELSSDHNGARHLELELRAPISGKILFAPAASGEWLNQGELLFEIQDLSQLHVAVRVPEADLPLLGDYPQAHLHHPSTNEQIELPGAEGKLLLAAPTVHPVTHSAEVLYEIPNPGWLRPGMTLAAHLATGQTHESLAVPISAVVDDTGIDVVFVQIAGESFVRRTVRLGIRDGDRVEILEGLAVGERVVIDGAYIVHLVSLAGTIPEHSH